MRRKQKVMSEPYFNLFNDFHALQKVSAPSIEQIAFSRYSLEPNSRTLHQTVNNEPEFNNQNPQKPLYPHKYDKSLAELESIEDSLSNLMKKNKNRQNKNRRLDQISAQTQYSSYSTPVTTGQKQQRLIEQINRVQNRIKQIKFERNLLNNHNARYENLQPFMEMQYQNMMNLERMMMMNQQGKNICCDHEKTKIEVVPIPMPSYQPYQNYPPNYPQSSPYDYGPNKENKQVMRSKHMGNTRKKYNFKKIRKFRIAVIAVCFALFFPKYSKRFTIRRYRQHQSKYDKSETAYEQQISNAFQEEISSFNYYKTHKGVSVMRKQKSRLEQMKGVMDLGAKVVISEQYRGQKESEIVLGNVQLVLLQFLIQIQQDIHQGKFQQTIQLMSQTTLPISFPVDNFYFIQEIYRLRLHKERLYLTVDELESKILIMNAFFIKLIYIDTISRFRDNEEWKANVIQTNKLKKGELMLPEVIATEMYLAGVLLIQCCIQIVQDTQLERGNMHLLSLDKVPYPFEILTEVQKQVGSNKTIKQSTRSISSNASSYVQFKQIKTVKSQKNSNQRLLGELENMAIYEFQYVKNLDQAQSLLSEIRGKQRFEYHIKEKIISITETLFVKQSECRREMFYRIKEELLDEEKDIMRAEPEDFQFKMMKRNPKNLKYFTDLIKVMKKNYMEEDQLIKRNNSQYSSYLNSSNSISKKSIKKGPSTNKTRSHYSGQSFQSSQNSINARKR